MATPEEIKQGIEGDVVFKNLEGWLNNLPVPALPHDVMDVISHIKQFHSLVQQITGEQVAIGITATLPQDTDDKPTLTLGMFTANRPINEIAVEETLQHHFRSIVSGPLPEILSARLEFLDEIPPLPPDDSGKRHFGYTGVTVKGIEDLFAELNEANWAVQTPEGLDQLHQQALSSIRK